MLQSLLSKKKIVSNIFALQILMSLTLFPKNQE